MELVTLSPNSITHVYRKSPHYSEVYSAKLDKYFSERKQIANLCEKKKSFNLSPASSRLLRYSVCNMILLSTGRTVDITPTKKIYNFKGAFITLTLPAKQFHTDVEIKKSFSKFLTNMRNTVGLVNYVWRMELQKNGNLHFHIVVDKYYAYNLLRYYWNLELKKLGYIERYQSKFKHLTLSQYANMRGLKAFEVVKAYHDGIKSDWSSPNTVSVNSVTSSKQLGAYLAKYMCKPVNLDEEESEENMLRASVVGKMWARSQSLSSLPKLSNFVLSDILLMITSIGGITQLKRMKFDYCTVYYIHFTSITSKFYKAWRSIFVRHAECYGYLVPT